MVAASADPSDFWHYCHADNVAELVRAENELAAVIAASEGVVSSITVIFDAPEADDQLDVMVPFACDITGVTVLGDVSGSIVIDIWKDTYANFPPTDADTITASAPPTISSSTKSQDTTLTGWTVSIAAGDVLRFNVDSVTDITRAMLSLSVVRT
jgi:hypothetical protein